MRPAHPRHNLTTYTRPLIASALIAGGLGQLALPVLAQTAAPANTTISNTAAASYEDEAGAKIETASNTVTITVAKVAGIYVKEVGFTNPTTAGSFQRGNTIYSNFEVKNTGNDGLKFKVPKLAKVVGSADFQEVQYLDPAVTANGGWITVGDGGADSQTIAVDGILKVRVKLKISSTAVNDSDITVTLGQTKTPGAINLQRGVGIGEDTDNNDIYTVDAEPKTGLVIIGGAAANGIREASAQQKIQVNATKQAVPTITLTNATPIADAGNSDTVQYSATVKVPKLDSNGVENADLAPTSIKLNTSTTAPTTADPGTGVATPRVIVALPIPDNVVLNVAPTPPTNWNVVYATKTGTVGEVVWSTTRPVLLSDVKQVGFIYEPTSATTPQSLPASDTVTTAFAVTVKTNGVGPVSAIASVYGTTPNPDGTPDTTKPARADANNTFTTTRTTVASPIYNGPVANAEATGPGGDNNTDFTNKSVSIPASDAIRADGEKLNTTGSATSVSFNNSVKNTNPGAVDIYLLPTPPAVATDLPNDTKVKISKSDGSESRTYTYSNGAFTTVSTDNFPTSTTATPPIKLTVAADGTVGYKVDVTLPLGIKQLVGYPVPVTAFTGGTVTAGMTVLPVAGGTGATATFAPTAQNITINRAYTGFINLVKEVRVLDAISQQNEPSNGAFTYLTGKVDSVKAIPGKFIQYRIRAVNISTAADASATDSQLLKAKNLEIVENGTTTGGNNWATTTTHESATAKTVNVANGTPVNSSIVYDAGKSDSQTNINVYTVKLTDTIQPGANAAPAFVFIRKVTAPDGKLGTTTTP